MRERKIARNRCNLLLPHGPLRRDPRRSRCRIDRDTIMTVTKNGVAAGQWRLFEEEVAKYLAGRDPAAQPIRSASTRPGHPPTTSKLSASMANVVAALPHEPEPGRHRAEHVQPTRASPIDRQRLAQRTHRRAVFPVMRGPATLLHLRDPPPPGSGLGGRASQGTAQRRTGGDEPVGFRRARGSAVPGD